MYAFFGKSGVVVFDVEGKKLWEKETGSSTHRFGSGASPILYKNLLVVQSTLENESLVAFDKVTGKEAWKVPASGYGCWSTPVLVDVEGGRKELVMKVPGEIWGLNPENGKLRWYVGGFGGGRGGGATCTSVVAHRGIVYGLGGRGSPSAAVRAGGRGDVSETRVVWKNNVGAYVPSPAIHDGHLYWASDRIATCLKLDTGEEVYRERLEGARDLYASVVIADGKIYAVSRWNGTFVIAAKPRFEQLAHNIFDSDESDFNASPAVSDGQLLLRSDRFLYCLGDTKKSTKTAGGG